MTQAVCQIASGEHQPWTRWAAASAGIAALWKSGYFAMCASISARSLAGTGVVAASGTSAGLRSRSTASSQPGTREPWPKRVTSRWGAIGSGWPRRGRSIAAVAPPTASAASAATARFFLRPIIGRCRRAPGRASRASR
jgi:hypothetical protein